MLSWRAPLRRRRLRVAKTKTVLGVSVIGGMTLERARGDRARWCVGRPPASTERRPPTEAIAIGHGLTLVALGRKPA